MTRLDYIEISKNFYYDETSPSGLRWAIDSGKKSVGDIAGSKSFNKNKSPKCWDIGFKKKLYKAHRIIAILFKIELTDDLVINHKDCNPFNNKIENLEVVDQKTNMRRCASHVGISLQTNNTSQINGVAIFTIDNKVKAYGACYRDEFGVSRTLQFSVSKYGDELSKLLAETARHYFIEKLETKGITYG